MLLYLLFCCIRKRWNKKNLQTVVCQKTDADMFERKDLQKPVELCEDKK